MGSFVPVFHNLCKNFCGHGDFCEHFSKANIVQKHLCEYKYFCVNLPKSHVIKIFSLKIGPLCHILLENFAFN
jgi:hypothetical protein